MARAPRRGLEPRRGTRRRLAGASALVRTRRRPERVGSEPGRATPGRLRDPAHRSGTGPAHRRPRGSDPVGRDGRRGARLLGEGHAACGRCLVRGCGGGVDGRDRCRVAGRRTTARRKAADLGDNRRCGRRLRHAYTVFGRPRGLDARPAVGGRRSRQRLRGCVLLDLARHADPRRRAGTGLGRAATLP